MQINILHQEIQKYISEHHSKQIGLECINSSTIRVSTDIQVWKLLKTIHVDITVENISGTNLYLSYSGGLSVELVIAPLLSFVKRLIPDQTAFIHEDGNNQLVVYLAEMEQFKKILEKADLNSITFDEKNINLHLFLK